MPFKSEAQRKYLWANEPEIARDWTDTYGSRIQKENGGIMRLGFEKGNDVDDDENELLKFIHSLGGNVRNIGSDIWSGITGVGKDISDKFSAPTKTAKKYTKMAFGPLMMLANRYNPLNPDAVNYNRHLQGQVDYLNQRGMLGDVGTGPYKIMSGALQGKNLVSGFGTNDYYNMLQKKRDWFENRLAKNKSIGEKHYANLLAEIEAVDAQGNIIGKGAGIPGGRGDKMDQPKTRGTFTGDHPDRPTKTPEQGGWHPGVAQGGLINFYRHGGFI